MKKIVASVVLMSSLSVFAQEVVSTSGNDDSVLAEQSQLRSARGHSVVGQRLSEVRNLNDHIKAVHGDLVYELNGRVLFDQMIYQIGSEVRSTAANYTQDSRNEGLSSAYASPSNGAEYFAENRLSLVLEGQRLQENQNPYIELLSDIFENYYLFIQNQSEFWVKELANSYQCNEVNLIAMEELANFLVNSNERALSQEGENQSLFQLRMTTLAHDARSTVNDMKFICRFAEQRGEEYQAIMNDDLPREYEIIITPAATASEVEGIEHPAASRED